jgi:hypothetical protein
LIALCVDGASIARSITAAVHQAVDRLIGASVVARIISDQAASLATEVAAARGGRVVGRRATK